MRVKHLFLKLKLVKKDRWFEIWFNNLRRRSEENQDFPQRFKIKFYAIVVNSLKAVNYCCKALNSMFSEAPSTPFLYWRLLR